MSKSNWAASEYYLEKFGFDSVEELNKATEEAIQEEVEAEELEEEGPNHTVAPWDREAYGLDGDGEVETEELEQTSGGENELEGKYSDLSWEELKQSEEARNEFYQEQSGSTTKAEELSKTANNNSTSSAWGSTGDSDRVTPEELEGSFSQKQREANTQVEELSESEKDKWASKFEQRAKKEGASSAWGDVAQDLQGGESPDTHTEELREGSDTDTDLSEVELEEYGNETIITFDPAKNEALLEELEEAKEKNPYHVDFMRPTSDGKLPVRVVDLEDMIPE